MKDNKYLERALKVRNTTDAKSKCLHNQYQ